MSMEDCERSPGSWNQRLRDQFMRSAEMNVPPSTILPEVEIMVFFMREGFGDTSQTGIEGHVISLRQPLQSFRHRVPVEGSVCVGSVDIGCLFLTLQ